jgi:RNA polymerase sigma factor (sigma-70 family)
LGLADWSRRLDGGRPDVGTAQPDSRPDAKQRHRNARLLSELLQQKEYLLRRQATRHAEGPDDVDDALQSAYTLFLERFRGDCEPLAWLYTTIKREAWALRRRTSRQREVSLGQFQSESDGGLDTEAFPSDAPGPPERMERKQLLQERRDAISALKPDERRALGMFGLGYSYREIADALGWTQTKINRCLSEGRAALRRST